MAVQLTTTNPVAFKGKNETEGKTTSSQKAEDVGTKIDEKVDTFTDGVESCEKAVDKTTNSIVGLAAKITGAIALLKGKFAPVINWFYKNVTENPEKPGEFIRENLNKTKIKGVGIAAAVVLAAVGIYKGIKSHNEKKAEAKAEQEANTNKDVGQELDITSEAA